MYTQKDGVAHQSIVPDDQMLYFTPELGIRHPQVGIYCGINPMLPRKAVRKNRTAFGKPGRLQ
jgi:hypothetical protein